MCIAKTPKAVAPSSSATEKDLPVIRNPILDGLLGNIAALRNGRNGLRIDRINPLAIPPGVGNTVGGGNTIGGGGAVTGGIGGGGTGTGGNTVSGGGGALSGGGTLSGGGSLGGGTGRSGSFKTVYQ